jgi:hypothetical protein
MAQTNGQVAALQLEKVRPDFETLFERDNVFYAMIKQKGEAEKVSGREMRVPMQIRSGGNAGQWSPAGGALGRGDSTQYEKGVVTPIFFKFGVEINKDVEYNTETSEKAVANAAKRGLRDGMSQFRAFLDKLCQTPGNGVLATVATAADPITVSGAFGTQLFYVGESFSAFTPDFVTKRVTDMKVVSINSATVMDIDALSAGVIATDVLTVTGLTAGAGTQQSLFGLPYHASDAATGTWEGLDRSLFPEIRTPSVDAGTTALSLDQMRLALNKFVLALGADSTPSDLVAYLHPAQNHGYEKLATAIIRLDKGSGNEKFDLLFGQGMMGGVPIKWSINADPTRIDFLSPSHFGRAVSKEIDLYEVDGTTVFPIYAADGGLAASQIFYIVTGFQIYHTNPRKGAYIKNLTKPTGY